MTIVGNARSLTDIDPVKLAELFSIQEAITHVVGQLIATGRTWPLERSKQAPDSTRSDFMATRLPLRTADEVNGLKVGVEHYLLSHGSFRFLLPTPPSPSSFETLPDRSFLHKLISTQGIVNTVSHSPEDKKSRCSSSGGTNPQATPFTPIPQKTGSTLEKIQPTKGIRTPQEFLLNLQSKEMEKKIEAAGTGRRVILKNLPTDATLTDVFCLIFNGQVENVTLNDRDATVDFVDTVSADAYFNKVCNGIRVGEHLITVERGTSPKITAHVVNCIKSRTTRVVHAIVPLNMTMKELYDAAAEFHVEHIEYHIEPNKVHT